MKTKETKSSSFIGFLDGYKAKNIAAMKPSLDYNLEEIDYNLNILIDLLEKDKNNSDLISSLKRSKAKLKSDKNILEIATIFGESLLNNFLLFEHANKNKKDIFVLLKKIIYNYVEFAKKSEDNRIIDLAKRIANNLDI